MAIAGDVGGKLKWDIQTLIDNIVSWFNDSESSNKSTLSAPEFLTREMHIVDGLDAKLIISTDVMFPETMDLLLSQKTLWIGSC